MDPSAPQFNSRTGFPLLRRAAPAVLVGVAAFLLPWAMALEQFPFSCSGLKAADKRLTGAEPRGLKPAARYTITGNALAEEPTPRAPVVPQRIIAIAPNSAEIICALGACDRIVGVSKFCVYPPELRERAAVGGLFDPDLERITALRPDLLVMRGRNDALERLCAELRVGIYRDETDSLSGLERCIRELGKITGREEQADRLIEVQRERIEAIRSRTTGKRRPRVLMTVSRQPDRLADILTAGRQSFLGEMIDIAGGTNAFGDLDLAYAQVSLEAILAKQPDVILEMMPETPLSDTMRASMLGQWRELGSMPAVKNDRVFFLTEENCLIPSPRFVEMIDKVSRVLHPEAGGE